MEAIDPGGDSYMSTLAEDPLPICPLCGKPCSPLKIASRMLRAGRFTRTAYRDALISQQGSL